MTKQPLSCRLDPELVPVVASLPASAERLHLDNIANFRTARSSVKQQDLVLDDDIDTDIPSAQSPQDGHRIPLLIRTPKTRTTLLPCVFWMHGGGFIGGSAFEPSIRLNEWCKNLPAVVVSVDYRLAPENPYPIPLEDCFTGLVWTIRHADRLGIDKNRIVIAGPSAGGGLAAGLALLARDRRLAPRPLGMLLIYPMIDDRTVTVPGGEEDDAPVWTYARNNVAWRAYLGHELDDLDPTTRAVSVYAAPARATDLDGLPQTFIGVGTVDIFCSENIHLAISLVKAGVAVELHVHPGGYHGFINHAPQAGVVRRFNSQVDDWLRRITSQPHGRPQASPR